ILIVRILRSSTLFPYTTLFRSSFFEKALLERLRLFCGGWPRVCHHTFRYASAVGQRHCKSRLRLCRVSKWFRFQLAPQLPASARSEEHTSELQSRGHLVCRLLL